MQEKYLLLGINHQVIWGNKNSLVLGTTDQVIWGHKKYLVLGTNHQVILVRKTTRYWLLLTK